MGRSALSSSISAAPEPLLPLLDPLVLPPVAVEPFRAVGLFFAVVLFVLFAAAPLVLALDPLD